MINKTFGNLLVISTGKSYTSPKGKKRRRWLCACKCGRKVNVFHCHLVSGHTRSCGACTSSNSLRRPKLTAFRNAVIRRDKGRCFACKTKRKVQVHHLYNFSSRPDLSGIVENGVCLCQKCHSEFHIWLGGFHVNCTPQDFLTWSHFKGLEGASKFVLALDDLNVSTKAPSPLKMASKAIL